VGIVERLIKWTSSAQFEPRGMPLGLCNPVFFSHPCCLAFNRLKSANKLRSLLIIFFGMLLVFINGSIYKSLFFRRNPRSILFSVKLLDGVTTEPILGAILGVITDLATVSAGTHQSFFDDFE
jgi:hypothetical protein